MKRIKEISLKSLSEEEIDSLVKAILADMEKTVCGLSSCQTYTIGLWFSPSENMFLFNDLAVPYKVANEIIWHDRIYFVGIKEHQGELMLLYGLKQAKSIYNLVYGAKQYKSNLSMAAIEKRDVMREKLAEELGISKSYCSDY